LADKQILFCTLFPFRSSKDTFVGEELTNIAINWRAREVRASSQNRVFPIVFSFEDCFDIEWTALHNIRYCTLSILLNRLEEPCGIRIYLMSSAISELQATGFTSPQFLAFETLLGACLKEFSYSDGSEKGSVKRKKVAADIEHTIDVPMSTQISNGFFWDYETKTFTDVQPSAFRFILRPTFLVSDLIYGWQETVLQCIYSNTRKSDLVYRANELFMPNCTLIVSKKPNDWLTASNKLDISCQLLEPSGLIASEDLRILVTDEETVASSFSSELNFMEMVDFMSTFVMGERSDTQIKRIILKFSQKLKNFRLPLGLITFGSIIIEDDCINAKNLLRESASQKWIHVFKDTKRAVPTSLSKENLRLLGANTICINRLKLDNFITVVPVPKSILRRIRIFGRPIKNGIVENRIASFFNRVFCPIPYSDALERFSGRAMPEDFAKNLMNRHFESCEVSLADFAGTASSKISKSFLMQSLESPRDCTICFESLDNIFGVTICGHIYCTECILRHFQASWTLNEPKECAHCRTQLFLGDLFHIDPKMTDYALSLPCKQAAITEFKNTFKGSLSTWPDVSGKCIIIDDISSQQACTVPALIQSLRDAKSATNVHIFYKPTESALFKEFSLEFM
jgi:hypothetical protein